MKFIYGLMLFWNLSKIARNPNNTQAGLNIGKCLKKMGLLEREMQIHQSHPETVRFIQEKRFLPKYDLQDLQKLPTGSLGRLYSDHMLKLGLNPDFYDHIPLTDDVAYTMMRMRETHDLWHILTGFGTTVPEELGLQAFMYAQIRTPLGPILIAGRTLVATFKNPAEVPVIFEQVARGWKMGLKAKPLFAFAWEDHWSQPLEQVRTQLQISNSQI